MVRRNIGARKILIVAGFLALGILSMFYFNYTALTGNAILSITTNYDPNSTLDGKMLLSLKPGELIPEDTNVLISIGDSSYEYLLKDLVNEDSVEGNFYGEGFSLTGSGNGFGVAGTKSSDVDFVMKVTKAGNSEGNSGSSNSGDSSGETTTEGTTTEGTTTEGTTTEGTTTEGTTTEGTTTETTTTEITTEESLIASDEISDSKNNGNSKEAKDNSNEKKNDKSDENSPNENSPNENSNSGSGESSDTSSGESLGGGIAGITGGVVASLETEVSGTVNKNEPYTYELNPGEKAEIISSSQDVTISQQGNIVTISTDYVEETGFGEDYLGGDYTYDLEIDLTSLNLDVEEGELVVELNYEGENLISVSSVLSVDNPQQTTITEEIVPTEIELTKDLALNDKELSILKENTGKDTAEISKAVESGERLIIRFEMGSYWSESSYDIKLDETEINYQIEVDRAKFLKRLSKSLLESKIETKDAEKYLGAENLYDLSKEIVVNDAVDENSSEIIETNGTGVNEEVVNVSEEINSVSENLTEGNTS